MTFGDVKQARTSPGDGNVRKRRIEKTHSFSWAKRSCFLEEFPGLWAVHQEVLSTKGDMLSMNIAQWDGNSMIGLTDAKFVIQHMFRPYRHFAKKKLCALSIPSRQ
jgi:hypothetical protein